MSEAEVEQLALIRAVAEAPQGSAVQEAVFQRLLEHLLPELDRYARRPYLPDDETDFIAIEVIAKLRHKNFENLRAFLAAHEADGQRRLAPWLRKLCRWKIANRLKQLLKSGLLAADEHALHAIEDHVKSTTLILGKLIRAESDALGRWLLEEAAAGLEPQQCIALHLFYQHTSDAPPGRRHDSARSAYAAIANELKLDGIEQATRVVTTAKQRFERAVRRLHEIEAAEDAEAS